MVVSGSRRAVQISLIRPPAHTASSWRQSGKPPTENSEAGRSRSESTGGALTECNVRAAAIDVYYDGRAPMHSAGGCSLAVLLRITCGDAQPLSALRLTAQFALCPFPNLFRLPLGAHCRNVQEEP